MKKISLLIMSVVALCAIAFVGCEKNSDVKPLEIATDEYVFVNPKWVLVDEDYCDEHGFRGALYVNENNERETKLEVVSMLHSKKCEDELYLGDLMTRPRRDPVTGKIEDVEYCDHRVVEKRDCLLYLQYDDDCVLISSEIVHIPSLR